MRLINTRTLQLESTTCSISKRRYAILSHRWRESEEVDIEEFCAADRAPAIRAKTGYIKIENACQMAQQHDFDYIWIDTCCIDKNNIAELSESINSMFRWYEEADICFAYLDDVCDGPENDPGDDFATSAWFSRGWTLQELLAPRRVEFFSRGWIYIGGRSTLAGFITSVTRIDADFLVDTGNSPRSTLLQTASVAQRMSWMADRTTKKEEDMAYCLLGIFGVNMPLLYGEGSNAFLRLQEEVARRTPDPSLLAWDPPDPQRHGRLIQRISIYERKSILLSAVRMVQGKEHPWCSENQPPTQGDPFGLFAPTPSCFRHCGSIISSGGWPREWLVTNQGLRLALPISLSTKPYMIIPCTSDHSPNFLAVPLVPASAGSHGEYRRACLPVKTVPAFLWSQWLSESVLLSTRPPPPGMESNEFNLQIRGLPTCMEVEGIFTEEGHFTPRRFLRIERTRKGCIVAILQLRSLKTRHLQRSPIMVAIYHQSGPCVKEDKTFIKRQGTKSWAALMFPDCSKLQHDPTRLGAQFTNPALTAMHVDMLTRGEPLAQAGRDGLLGPFYTHGHAKNMFKVEVSRVWHGNQPMFQVDISQRPEGWFKSRSWNLYQVILRIFETKGTIFENIQCLDEDLYLAGIVISIPRMPRRHWVGLVPCMLCAVAAYAFGSVSQEWFRIGITIMDATEVVLAAPLSISWLISTFVYVYLPMVSLITPTSSRFVKDYRFLLSTIAGAMLTAHGVRFGAIPYALAQILAWVVLLRISKWQDSLGCGMRPDSSDIYLALQYMMIFLVFCVKGIKSGLTFQLKALEKEHGQKVKMCSIEELRDMKYL